MILKTGIYLLVTSSIRVCYRNADFAYSAIPGFKWTCAAGLCLSLGCFVLLYLRSDAPLLYKAFSRLPHMIKSPTWKFSSQP